MRSATSGPAAKPETFEQGRIVVCVGSACHLKGSAQVVEVFERKLAEAGLDGHIELSGAFCLGPCADAVAVQVAGQRLVNINAANAAEVFERDILPLWRPA